MIKAAKIALQVPLDQQHHFFSAKQLVLLWRYHSAYETLHGMLYGAGLLSRAELGGLLLGMTGDTCNENSASADFGVQIANATDVVFADYAQRRQIEWSIAENKLREPWIFAQLMRANATRTVRKLVRQSRWLRQSNVGLLLWECPESFFAIRRSRRFPKRPDNQIEFLARALGAMLAAYKPTTGSKYLSKIVRRCEHCDEKPAIVTLNRGYTAEEQQPAISPTGLPDHKKEQCRYSTWPCRVHHPTSPPISGTPWCGEC
jgi:hypothetical protein